MARYFEEFEVGDEFTTAGRTITEADLVSFAGWSGDYNPLHTDEEFARATPYGARIAHGALILSVAIGLVSRTGLTDGTALGFLSIDDWHFLAPVMIGDTVTVDITVTDKRPTSKPGRGILKRHLRVLNQRGETVQEGDTTILVKAR